MQVRPLDGGSPHVCGGTATPGPDDVDADGVSPRVRRNPTRRRKRGLRLRGLPTCAEEPEPPPPSDRRC